MGFISSNFSNPKAKAQTKLVREKTVHPILKEMPKKKQMYHEVPHGSLSFPVDNR